MLQVDLSINVPIKYEIIAPPTIDVDKNPEAWVVNLPKPLADKEKIIANITAVSYTHLTLPTNREV